MKLEALIKDGELIIPSMPKLKDGDYVVSIKKKRETRTYSQLKYLFGVVYKIIAKETGHDIDDIHSAMKDMFLKSKLMLHRTDQEGREVTYWIPYTQSLSDVGGVSIESMIEYIENVRKWAGEWLGLIIPDPI
jgi:hypothetical protein